MFHKGATIPHVGDLLEGDGKEARTARFGSLDDIESKKDELQKVVKSWIELQDQN
jgi:hypothetical protein